MQSLRTYWDCFYRKQRVRISDMIALMSRVELVCLRSIRAELVRTLQDRGLLHLDEVALEVEEAPDFLSRVALEGDEYTELTATEEAERSLAEVAPLLTSEPSAFDVQASIVKLSELNQLDLFRNVTDWAEQLRETTRKRVDVQDQLDVLNNYRGVIEQVAPALGNDVNLGKGTRALVLGGDVARAVSRIEERLENEFGSDYTFHKNQTSKKQLVGLLSFPEDKSEVVSKILNQEGVAPMDMSSDDYSDLTAREVLDKINTTIANLKTDLGALEGEANTVSLRIGADVLAARSIIGDAVARLRVAGNFAQSEMIAVIHGWTPSDEYDALKSVIDKEYEGKVDVNQIDGGDEPHSGAPTLLQNHKFIRPFEICMSVFRPPTYGTIDPTAMVAVAFILFYGLILGDFVYGMVLIGLAKFLGRKLGHIDVVKDIVTIATSMGVSGAIFGIMYGEYCGDLLMRFWPSVPVLFHRAHEPEQLLIWAIYIGIFHVLLGLVLGIKESFRHGHKMHGLEKLGMFLGLIALLIQSFANFDVAPFNSSIFTVLSVIFFAVGVVLIFYTMKFMGFIGLIE
ncbi:MAG TPA: hypothetical protein EYN96_07390, partial [Candidatus Hydrogenedentes bacterium]|nr:hypothetical protein [Candidatus Hydrogenedentota bacterium]